MSVPKQYVGLVTMAMTYYGSFYCTTSILYYSDGEQTGFPFNELPKSICPPRISKWLCPSGLATLIPGKK